MAGLAVAVSHLGGGRVTIGTDDWGRRWLVKKRRKKLARRKPRQRKSQPRWASWPDERLLKLRLKDLKLPLRGTWLAACLRELNAEMAEKGLKRVRAHGWISSEWFSPGNTPGIAFPFYLAHPRLMRLERKMIIDVEGGTHAECMRILRHEAGHVLQHSYALHKQPRWRRLFGRSSIRYPKLLSRPIRPAGISSSISGSGTRKAIPMRISPRRSRSG